MVCHGKGVPGKRGVGRAYRVGEMFPLHGEIGVEHSKEKVVLGLHCGRELELEFVVEERRPLPRHHLRRG